MKETSFAVSEAKQERGAGYSNRTVDKYKYDFHRAMKIVEEKTGKNDPNKVRPNDIYNFVYAPMIEEYKQGKTEHASFLRGLDDALHAFAQASKASGVYKREIRTCDKRKTSQMLNENKVFRYSKDTTVMQATREDKEKVVEQLLLMKEKTNSEGKKQKIDAAINVLDLELATGRRISALLRSHVDNYDKETGQYTTFGDKGGKDNESYFLTSEAKEILDRVTEGKNGGAMIFTIKYSKNHPDPNKRGQDKPVESMRKEVSALIKDAAEKAGVNRDGQKFSSHACRKGFAEERALDYIKNMSADERRAELQRRRDIDPRFNARIEKVMDHIKSKFKNKTKAANRQFTDKEIIQLLVSSDINHSRKDVMRYYLGEEFWESVEDLL